MISLNRLHGWACSTLTVVFENITVLKCRRRFLARLRQFSVNAHERRPISEYYLWLATDAMSICGNSVLLGDRGDRDLLASMLSPCGTGLTLLVSGLKLTRSICIEHLS